MPWLPSPERCGWSHSIYVSHARSHPTTKPKEKRRFIYSFIFMKYHLQLPNSWPHGRLSMLDHLNNKWQVRKVTSDKSDKWMWQVRKVTSKWNWIKRVGGTVSCLFWIHKLDVQIPTHSHTHIIPIINSFIHWFIHWFIHFGAHLVMAAWGGISKALKKEKERDSWNNFINSPSLSHQQCTWYRR